MFCLFFHFCINFSKQNADEYEKFNFVAAEKELIIPLIIKVPKFEVILSHSSSVWRTIVLIMLRTFDPIVSALRIEVVI